MKEGNLKFRTLFTELQKKIPLSFCDVAKLAWFRKYIGISIHLKNFKIFKSKKCQKSIFFFLFDPRVLIFGLGGHNMIILDCCAGILKIFVFRPEIGSESRNFGFSAQNRDFQPPFWAEK